MKRRIANPTVLLLLALCASASAQIAGTQPFTFSAVADRNFAMRGDVVHVAIIVNVAPLNKLYRKSVSVSFPAHMAADVVSVDIPSGFAPHEPGGDSVLLGQNIIVATLKVRPGAGDSLRLDPTIAYQGCSDQVCFAPALQTLPLTLPITSDRSLVKPQNEAVFRQTAVAASTELGALAKEISSRQNFQHQVAERGYTVALLAAFASGFLVSLTPCVWPLIPIILAVVGAAGEGAGWRRGLGLSLAYVLGMSITYAILGALAGLLGKGVEGFAQNPWLAGIVCLAFVALALSMFGLYDIRTPAALTGRLQQRRGVGFLGVLLTGLVSGLVASPCVSAPLLGLFAGVATLGNVWIGALAGFLFALGMGVILLVAGTSSNALAALPRSGDWMIAVKHFFGWVLLAVAAWYSQMIFGPRSFYLLALLILLGASAQVAWRIRPNRFAVVRVVAILILLGGAGYYAWQLRGTFAASPAEAIRWNDSVESGLAAAKTDGKPVIIDVAATWCTYCHEMDRDVFSRSDVAGEAARFVMIRFDASVQTQKVVDLYAKYGIIGPPAFVFVPTSGEPVTVNGKLDAETFLKFMHATR